MLVLSTPAKKRKTLPGYKKVNKTVNVLFKKVVSCSKAGTGLMTNHREKF